MAKTYSSARLKEFYDDLVFELDFVKRSLDSGRWEGIEESIKGEVKAYERMIRKFERKFPSDGNDYETR